MRIARDGFTGSGEWDSALWPYTDWIGPTERPLLTQQDGLGVVTNYSQDYKYVRRYFTGGSRQNYGLLARGRFTTAGANANMRVMLRASRATVPSDKTYPADGYTVFFERGNSTISVQKVVNNTTSQVVNFTIASAPGTGWWNVRMEAQGTTLRIKFWTGVSEEPAAFNRTVTDSSISQGEAALSTGYHANQVTQIDYFETYDFNNLLVFGGSITPTSTKRKQARKRMVGTIAAVGTLATRRVVMRLFAGSITGAGTAVRRPLRVLSGSITPRAIYSVGLITKRLGGALVPSGNPRRASRRTLGGSILPRGEVSVRSVGRISGLPGIVAVTVRVAGQLRARVRKG